MSALVVLPVVVFAAFALLVFYALRTKGEVRAECSSRLLTFSLHARQSGSPPSSGERPSCGEHRPPTAPAEHAPKANNASQ